MSLITEFFKFKIYIKSTNYDEKHIKKRCKSIYPWIFQLFCSQYTLRLGGAKEAIISGGNAYKNSLKP